MKRNALIFMGSTAFCLGLGVASAMAGPCTAEIERVTKVMSERDAGSGPTTGAASQNNASSSAVGGQHPPTEAVSQGSGGTAISPQDVRRQTQGEGMATAGSGESAMDTGMAALQRARDLDAQGKEAECMKAAGEAGRMLEKK